MPPRPALDTLRHAVSVEAGNEGHVQVFHHNRILAGTDNIVSAGLASGSVVGVVRLQLPSFLVTETHPLTEMHAVKICGNKGWNQTSTLQMPEPVKFVAISPDATLLVVIFATSPCSAHLWDVERSQCVTSLPDQVGSIKYALLSSCNSLVVTTTETGNANVCHTTTRRCIAAFAIQHPFLCAAFS